MSKLLYLKDCSSTNDEISKVLLYPESDFVAIYTFNQKKGRGQYGNQWLVNPNENLAFTIAIKTKNIFVSDYHFNYYTAIIIRDFIDKLTDANVKIKWPNDIILNKKKVCGILIEKKKYNSENYFIIGIGINILQNNFNEIKNAGSILTQTGKKHDLFSIAENLYNDLVFGYKNIKSEEEILLEYNNHLFRKDVISVFEIDHIKQNGIIRSANEYGKITIELENEVKQFYLKEVKLLY